MIKNKYYQSLFESSIHNCFILMEPKNHKNKHYHFRRIRMCVKKRDRVLHEEDNTCVMNM